VNVEHVNPSRDNAKVGRFGAKFKREKARSAINAPLHQLADAERGDIARCRPSKNADQG
jgi:putative component of toxin-antitoxin plasmid stabilization module